MICALLACAFAGCAGPKEAAKILNLPVDSVMARVARRNARVFTLKGSGSITVESPEASNSGSFDVDLKKPDSVLASFKGPFGLHVGTLSLAREKFVYFDQLHNDAIIGKPDGSTIRSMFNLNMDFDEILNAFTGDFPMPAPGDSLERFAFDEDNLYYALYKRSNEEREYHIDASTFMIASYRELDSLNKPVVIATSGRYDADGEIPMARLLRVIFPHERRAITVAYDNVTPNDSVSCAFTLPENVEKIYR